MNENKRREFREGLGLAARGIGGLGGLCFGIILPSAIAYVSYNGLSDFPQGFIEELSNGGGNLYHQLWKTFGDFRDIGVMIPAGLVSACAGFVGGASLGNYVANRIEGQDDKSRIKK